MDGALTHSLMLIAAELYHRPFHAMLYKGELHLSYTLHVT